MDVRIDKQWKEALADEFQKPYFADLAGFVREEYSHHVCFPPAKMVFEAFNLCPLESVKVVILGQDPYHGQGQAEGLCFSVADGVRFPPSLRNIFLEIADDLHKPIPASGSLRCWAKQGVLLLNATLTVREHQAGSHQNHGWERFTDRVISVVSEQRDGVVFLLWGSYAISKLPLIDQKRHLALTSPHPSPLSAYRGFFKNRHFSRTNAFLRERGIEEINW